MDFELFCRAGEGLLGPEWHRMLARDLGAFHPDGRDVDPRMLRRWAKGERGIPEWVAHAMATMAQRDIDNYLPKVRALQELKDQLLGSMSMPGEPPRQQDKPASVGA